MLIDTHAHLYLEHFTDDLEEVVQRCRSNQVEKVFLPNIDSESLPGLKAVCQSYPNIFYPLLGLHPCSVKTNWREELDTINDLIRGGLSDFPGQRIYGIGEIGLDYYWDTSFKAEQQEALRIQVNWAKELQLPIILHCRDAFEDLFRIVEEMNDENLTGIFHCFSGSLEEARSIIGLGGFYMGLGGVLTFKKSSDLREVIRQVPLEHLVLETDAPYLTPAPHRGKRNESAYVLHVAEQLADIHGISLDDIATATTANSATIFGLDQPENLT